MPGTIHRGLSPTTSPVLLAAVLLSFPAQRPVPNYFRLEKCGPVDTFQKEIPMEFGLEQIIIVVLTGVSIGALVYLRKRSQATEEYEKGKSSGKLSKQ